MKKGGNFENIFPEYTINNELVDEGKQLSNTKQLSSHQVDYDPLAYYEGNKLDKYGEDKAKYLELLKQKSSSSDSYKKYVNSTLNSIKKEQEELKSPFIFNPDINSIKGGKKKLKKRSKSSKKRKSKK